MFGSKPIIGESFEILSKSFSKDGSLTCGHIILPRYTLAEPGDRIIPQVSNQQINFYSEEDFAKRSEEFERKIAILYKNKEIDYSERMLLRRSFYGTRCLEGEEIVSNKSSLRIAKSGISNLNLGNRVLLKGREEHLELYPSYQIFLGTVGTVYRVVSRQEFDYMMRERRIMGDFYTRSSVNTHKYEEGVKYSHFYRDKTSILYVNSCAGSVLCEFKIPLSILKKYKGLGYYIDFINFKDRREVVEFAIPSRLLTFTDLEKASLITEFIDVEDFAFGEVDNKLETLYENEISVSMKMK